MALIAPGAFLWTTFQGQSAYGATSMWASVAVATIVALLTAVCYATLSKKYPQGGAGSSYFYAEAAFLEKEAHSHFKLARIAKLIIGCAAHLYYWVYPGVMVAFMGTILTFIIQLFKPTFGDSRPSVGAGRALHHLRRHHRGRSPTGASAARPWRTSSST